MRSLLILSLFCVGCGEVKDFINEPFTQEDPRQFRSVHPDLEEFYSSFHEETGVSPWHVSSGFAKLEDDKVAICTKWGGKYPQITFNTTYWPSFNYDRRHQTMMHEFGHCVLNLDHRDDWDNGCPTSVMNTYIFSPFHISYCYLPRFDYYINELLN